MVSDKGDAIVSKTRAIIYVRQSLDKTAEELGIKRQLAECKKLCEYRSFEVVEIVQDNNRSASSGVRPGYQQVVAKLKAGEAEHVVILRIDRLMRLNDELEELIKLAEESGITVNTV